MSEAKVNWLASYPRSGSRWVRSLFGVYALGREPSWGIPENGFIGLHKILKPCKDAAEGHIAFQQLLLQEAAQIKGRFPATDFQLKTPAFRTHFKWSDSHPLGQGSHRVIYLQRNPKDVFISCLEFHKTQGFPVNCDAAWLWECIENGGPPRYLKHFGSWFQHYQSWSSSRLPVHTVQYEALKRNTLAEFLAMLKFMQVPVDKERAKMAVKLASLASMRKKQDENRRQMLGGSGSPAVLKSYKGIVNTGYSGQSFSAFETESYGSLDKFFETKMRSSLEITGYL